VAVIFRLDDVSYRYHRSTPPVLRGMTFELPAGKTVAVLGLSGLGKTTLLNLLCLLWDRRDGSGRIFYHSPRKAQEEDCDLLSPAERAHLRSTDFGLVPQTAHFLPGFTCEQNLRLPLALQGATHRKAGERLGALLDTVSCPGGPGHDLKETLNRYPARVSTGQRQRLAVLRAVIHNPVVLFADEPVSNLDAENKCLMFHLFALWRGNDLHWRTGTGSTALPRTLVLVCHEAETAWETADLFLFLAPPPRGEHGATAELVPFEDFCKTQEVSDGRTDNSHGPEALRRYLRRISRPAIEPAQGGLS
jgi:ABC-type lipoprotein export system ATPase subunit